MTASALTPGIDIRRSGDRFATRAGWLDSRHSFSFSRHWDPDNTHHGVLLVNNDDVVEPGTGFDTHPHRDMEIITWVTHGSLVHQDSTGHTGVIHPGLAQRMSAGTGIMHSEKNDSWTVDGQVHNTAVRFIQMWVVPDTHAITPGYAQAELDDADLASGLVTVASGMDTHRNNTAVTITNRYAALHAARLVPGQSVTVPDAPFTHVFITTGTVDFEGSGTLSAGDAVRTTATGGQRITAHSNAEVLVWEMHATMQR